MPKIDYQTRPAPTVTSSNVASLLSLAASDKKITSKEAAAIAKEIAQGGVTETEKQRIRTALQAKRFQDAFEPGAAAPLRSLLSAPPVVNDGVKGLCAFLSNPPAGMTQAQFAPELIGRLGSATQQHLVNRNTVVSTQLTKDEKLAIKRAYDRMPMSPLKETAAYLLGKLQLI